MTHIAGPVVVGVAQKQPSTLGFAVREARVTRSRLRVVHAVALPAQAVAFYVGVNEDLVEEACAEGQAVLDDARRLVEELDPGLEADYVLVQRDAVETLIQEAAVARSVVVGVDDVPWLERLMRTRVAGHLTRHAPCPVIVVPEHEPPASPGGEVVLTLDGTTPARGPVGLAFEEASARGCVLHVLHATSPATLAADSQAARAAVAEVVAGWCEVFPDVTVLEALAVGEPEDAIVRATRRAELVVMGRPHDDHVPLALSRPLAMRILPRARCPVAIVPDDGRRQ